MNPKRAKIEALLALSSDLDFKNNSISGTVQPVSVDDIALINTFIDRTFNDDFQYEKITPKINEVSTYRLNLIRDEKNYASYQSYIEHKLDINKKNNISDDDVIYESIIKVKSGEDDYISELKLFHKFLRALTDNYYQKDNILIFFSKNYCEVPIQIRSFNRYLELAKFYKENENSMKSFNEFLNWILEQKQDVSVSEPLNIHKNELYVIVATEIIEHLTSIEKQDRIFYLIKNIESLLQDTKAKYGLYLEDFKYSKFIEKINKYADEFLVKVNKVITDLQTQVLAIPLAVAAITAFKETDKINDFIYAGFLIYLIMVFYASCQQAYNLKHIEIQIQQFDSIAKLPKDLSSKWEEEILPVNKKILWHKAYLVAISIFIGVLAGICIINIEFLYGLILEINYLIFFITLFVISSLLKIWHYFSSKKKNRDQQEDIS
ncbi:hypothetical protein B9X71_08980 [Acinetobacter baumannii]|uniref:hypothetical protein n=1 Tax=Acinetobacter baumannii TaxID=470 RepID=UPI000A345451|nr:hypothetical protein [Acinetobacter baumannii]OTK46959.1 hypothetical protein B9X71_08980 [Acinetobacter baumannii]